MYKRAGISATPCGIEHPSSIRSTLIEDVMAAGWTAKLDCRAGEFGRTPRLVETAGLIGRDHWPDAQSALISGGGLRMGQVIGATNRRGEYPAERPLIPKNIPAVGMKPVATISADEGTELGASEISFFFEIRLGKPGLSQN